MTQSGYILTRNQYAVKKVIFNAHASSQTFSVVRKNFDPKMFWNLAYIFIAFLTIMLYVFLVVVTIILHIFCIFDY